MEVVTAVFCSCGRLREFPMNSFLLVLPLLSSSAAISRRSHKNVGKVQRPRLVRPTLGWSGRPLLCTMWSS